MKIDYAITLADLKAAERLHINQRISRRIGYGSMYIGVPILAVLGLIGFYAFNIGEKSDLSLGYSIIEFILITQAIIIPIERFKRLRKPLQAKTSKGEVRALVEVNEDKVLSEIPGMTRMEFTWGAIVVAVQDENVTLLYLNDKDFILIPTRAFTPSERTEFQDLVARHIKVRNLC